MRIYVFCLVVLVPTGGFSFIHHRYLYPIMYLVILAVTLYLQKDDENVVL